jgi:hypothetical protein
MNNSKMFEEHKEVVHNQKECYLMSSGVMNDSNLMRDHIVKKIVDPDVYKVLKETDNFIIDPLNAWGLRTENMKVRKAREKYQEMARIGKEEDFLLSENLKDLVNFYALDKYDVGSALMEKETGKPQIINKDRAARVVFETYDGSYIQVEQEMELVVFLWDRKKREDYFYREAGKFRDSCTELFKGIISHLMRLRNSPLNFVPRATGVINK